MRSIEWDSKTTSSFSECPYFQVHLLEQEEAKRQVLRKRAERTAVEEETNINWDDEDEEQSGEPSISEELQVESPQVDYSGIKDVG